MIQQDGSWNLVRFLALSRMARILKSVPFGAGVTFVTSASPGYFPSSKGLILGSDDIVYRDNRGSLLEATVSAFNMPNRAAFANPVSYTGSALFGQPVSIANFMLGSGTPTTGQTPLFQAGGARTVEVGLKISF